jgi:hypothetical protein
VKKLGSCIQIYRTSIEDVKYRLCLKSSWWAVPTQPFQCERLYCFLDRHRVRFLGFGNYGVPLLDRKIAHNLIEEGHSTTSIDRFSNGFTPSQASSFVRIERTGSAHPTGTTKACSSAIPKLISHLFWKDYI